jgi:hypothetical protein
MSRPTKELKIMRSTRVAGFSLAWVLRVTIAAIVGILFFKWGASKVPVPGLQRVAAAV